jgi:hypothetical protein
LPTYSYIAGTIQKVTVATGGTYDITAYGAQGGASAGVSGGAGAEVGGDFTLTAGERLEIVVGGAGGYGQTSPGDGSAGGGGGGSFVLASTNGGASYQLLLAAGGGGGAYIEIGGNASFAAGASGSGAGGAGGGGSSGPEKGASKFDSGGGGSGYNGDGVGYSGRAGGGSNRTGGYAGGVQAGKNLGYTGAGGFGGGGGGNQGGGGGGGYSGGKGGYYVGGGAKYLAAADGGGGTSKDKGTPLVAQSAATENAAQSGNGEVLISPKAACYCRGSLILTERGEVAVEHLQIGDRVVTASGLCRPIVWLGHRALNVSRHREPLDLWPVRVAASAFGEGLPRRDLWLSPGHNIAAEGVIMPICALINGHSVAQVKQDKVEYWHVELDAHDILLAEGLPAESYLDCGNRTAFVNGGAFVEAYPNFQPKYWAETCLPLVHGGIEVVAAKARLMAVLVQQGFALTREAGAHVVADGKRLDPVEASETKLVFVLPVGAKTIALGSNVFIPAQTVADSVDPRELGLCVIRLEIDGSTIPLDRDELFGAGWHKAEYEDNAVARRWTSGDAGLPAAGARNVVVELGGQGYYWRAPMQSDAPTQAASA